MGQRSSPTRKPAEVSQNGHPPHQVDLGLERLIFFSDAVFAIAITLLALEVRLPAGVELADNTALTAALLAIWPKYMSYAISFLVIGLYWMAHHRMFRLIVRYDRRLLFLNLLLLLVIAFVPFPTALLGEFGYVVTTFSYALTMLLAGLLSAAIWWYASGGGGRLLAQPLPPAELRRSRLRALIAPGIFLGSLGLAVFDSGVARLSWILIGLVALIRPAET
jgi:uncharacterized membrane protein